MWAVEPVLAKLSYANSDFLHTSAMRAIFVALISFFYTTIGRRASLRVDRRQFCTLAYIAVAGTLFADLAYFLALTRVPVLNAVLIGHMQPIFVILIGFHILREDRLTRIDLVGIAFMIVSALLVTTRTMENLLSLRIGTAADALVLAATIAWATTGIAMRKYLRNMDAAVITFYRYLLASIVFAIYVGSTSSIAVANPYQVLVGIVVAAGTIFYYEGMKRIKAAQVSALELSTPFFAVFLSLFILGESVTMMQLSGIALLAGGVYCLSRKEGDTGQSDGSLPSPEGESIRRQEVVGE